MILTSNFSTFITIELWGDPFLSLFLLLVLPLPYTILLYLNHAFDASYHLLLAFASSSVASSKDSTRIAIKFRFNEWNPKSPMIIILEVLHLKFDL